MKKLFLYLFLLILCVPVNAFAQSKREVRAVWLATNYGLDWPRGKYWGDAAETLMIDMLDKLQAAHFNTVIFQVQCLGDVFWESEIQPWSKQATGKYGQKPKFDVCQFVIDECHKRGMEVHAGIVPYRIGTQANADGYNDLNSNHKHVINLHPELCLKGSDDAWYLDPGLPAVREYLINLYEELVTTTSFDGLNLDYTRYPDCTLPDEQTFALYNPDGLSKPDWRRDNINKFVFALYDMMKQHKPLMKLGAAPIGTYKNLPGKGNLEAYGGVYQDACEWMKQGKHDLLITQMYWTEDFGFSPNMDVWIQNCAGRQLVIGLAAYKMADGNKWPVSTITDQIEVARRKGTQGVSFFRTDHVVGDNATELYNALATDYFKYPAYIPTMDYNGITKPNKPQNVRLSKNATGYTVSWDAPELDSKNTPIRYYSVYAQEGKYVDINNPKNIVGYAVAGNSCELDLPEDKSYTVAVTAFDYNNYESDPVFVDNMSGVATEHVQQVICTVADGRVHIVSDVAVSDLAVYSMSGEKILSQNACMSKEEISLANLQGGVYILTIGLENGSQVHKKIIL